MVSRLSFRRALFSTFVLSIVVGCNAVLDNQHAQLGDPNADVSPTEPAPGGDDAGTTEPVTPPTPDDPCGAGKHTCNGTCVSDADPAYGCGSASCQPCATPPHGVAACSAGQCILNGCEPHFADCNKNPADGCEADLTQASSCGACGAACPPATPICAPSGATSACTNGCGATAPLRCGDKCVNPLSDVKNCGACGLACPGVEDATTTCTNGVCGFDCKAPKKACNGKCVKPNDPQACGPTCAPCPALPNTVASCPNDACVYTCNQGFADCNLLAADGCESNLLADPAHCGACNVACPVGSTCTMGVCTAPPPPAH